jgi:hypothetical protein
MTVSDTTDQKNRGGLVGLQMVGEKNHLRPFVPLYDRAHQLRRGKPGYRPGLVSSLGMPP